MDFYYLSEFNDKGNNAGSKARNDINYIFSNNKKFKSLIYNKITAINTKGILYYIKNYININILLYKIHKIDNCILFIQYPILKSNFLKKVLENDFKNKNIIICYIIHDINFLRYDENQSNKNLINEEIEFLNTSNFLITHNKYMSKKLYNNGLKIPTIELELFDYIYENKNIKLNRSLSKTVVYAGNLGKSIFLKNLIIKKENLGFDLNLYGSGLDIEMIDQSTGIKYMGSYSPDVIIEKINGSFGLVWDGISLSECKGHAGSYLKYNNPHKLSLYIAAELPVIVWTKSAVSDFVEKHNIGFSIDNIYEIESKLNNITDEKYLVFLNNIRNIKTKVVTGDYIMNAVDKIIQKLTKEDL